MPKRRKKAYKSRRLGVKVSGGPKEAKRGPAGTSLPLFEKNREHRTEAPAKWSGEDEQKEASR